MENMLVPEIFFSMQKMFKQMECRMLIGSIFIAASIVAVALTTLCLILNSIWKFVSAKRSNSNSERTELGEETRTENQDEAEASSMDTSAPETEHVAEKPEAERERATSSPGRSVPENPENPEKPERERARSSAGRSVPEQNRGESDLGDEECEQRERVSRRYCGEVRDLERKSVHGIERGRVRYALRILHPERESVRGAPSLPPFKNTRRLKLSTLVLILYSAFFKFVSLPMVLRSTGNVILVNSISLIITSFSPLLLVRMEQDILSFVKKVFNNGEFN